MANMIAVLSKTSEPCLVSSCSVASDGRFDSSNKYSGNLLLGPDAQLWHPMRITQLCEDSSSCIERGEKPKTFL